MAGLLSSDGSFYDPAKLQALLAQIQPGADGRKVLGNDAWMQLLNPISGLQISQAADPGHLVSGGDSQDPFMSPATQAVYKDAQGRTYRDDGSGNLTYFDNSGTGWQNPTGNSGDRVQPTYKLNADGTATPVSSGAAYQPSEWVSSGRDVAKVLGTVLAAGASGAALAGGEAGAGGAGGAVATGAGDVGYMGAGSLGAGSSADAATTLGAGGMLGGGGAVGGGALGATGAGGAVAGGGGVANAAGVAGSSLIPGISNGQLLTTGAGLLGGALGSNSSLNSATNSTQNKIDPRIAQYLYGANGSGGLLNSVNNLTNAQLATGGLNANQSQGLQMQLNALNDPGYTQGLAQMRSAGQGLLGSGVAANPFTSGGAGFNPQAGQGPQPTPQGMQPGWQPMRTQLNAPIPQPMPQQQPGMMTGLLGNNRPYGQ